MYFVKCTLSKTCVSEPLAEILSCFIVQVFLHVPCIDLPPLPTPWIGLEKLLMQL